MHPEHRSADRQVATVRRDPRDLRKSEGDKSCASAGQAPHRQRDMRYDISRIPARETRSAPSAAPISFGRNRPATCCHDSTQPCARALLQFIRYCAEWPDHAALDLSALWPCRLPGRLRRRLAARPSARPPNPMSSRKQCRLSPRRPGLHAHAAQSGPSASSTSAARDQPARCLGHREQRHPPRSSNARHDRRRLQTAPDLGLEAAHGQ